MADAVCLANPIGTIGAYPLHTGTTVNSFYVDEDVVPSSNLLLNFLRNDPS